MTAPLRGPLAPVAALRRRPVAGRRPAGPRTAVRVALHALLVLALLAGPPAGGERLARGLAAGLVLAVAAGGAAVVALLPGHEAAAQAPAGRVWAWGTNTFGQVSNGGNSNIPAPVPSFSGTNAAGAGDDHSLALKPGGGAWSWGSNRFGQLGAASTGNCAGFACSTVPIQVGSLSDVVVVAGGSNHTLWLKRDGTVWAAGLNNDGQLGDGSNTSRSIPVQVSGLSGVTAIAAGQSHSLALAGGTVYTWGRRNEGALGNEPHILIGSRNYPLPVTGVVDAWAIGAGWQHSLAATRGGGVASWGANSSGQLGDGTTTLRREPVGVVGLSGAVAVDGGNLHSAALLSDGSVRTWGQNLFGQLGTGTSGGSSSTPVAAVGLSGAVGLAVGGNHVLALKPDGTVWGWGRTFTATPTYLSSVGPGVTYFAAGGAHSLTVQDGVDGLPLEPADDDAARREPTEDGGTGGDPVHTLTGAFLYRRTDVAIPGRGPAIDFARSYSSKDARVGPLGPGWTHSYDVRLARPSTGSEAIILTGPYGRADRYAHDGNGVYRPPKGIYTTLVRNADGTYTATHRDQTTWTFDASGRLTRITDRHGNQSNLTYNSGGKLTAVADPAGRGSFSFGYRPDGRLTSVTDWHSPARTVQFGYDASNRLQTVTDREGRTTTYAYDGSSSRLRSITDARSNVAITLTYDGQGRVETQKDARGLTSGQQTTFSYVTNGDGSKTSTVTYPPTSYEPGFSPTQADTYDLEGRIVKRVWKPTSSASEDVTVEFGYDASSNLTSYEDGRGNVVNLCYDVDENGATIAGSKGNLTRWIDPAPSGGANRPVTLLRFDSKNNLTRLVPPKGVGSGASVSCTTNLGGSLNLAYAIDLTYDAGQNRLLSISGSYTDPDLGQLTAVTKLEYGDAANPGLPTKIIPPRGNIGGTPDYSYSTTLAYFGSGSRAGLLESVTDPHGHAAGGVPAQHTWEVSWDREDRPRFLRAPAATAGGAQLVVEARYDAVGNPEVLIDALGQVTKYVWDERDNLQEVRESPSPWTDPAAGPSPLYLTGYEYDHANNLTRVLRAKGDGTYERAVDYAYDGLGRPRRETQYPSWPSTSPTLLTQVGYDANSNQTSLVDPLGRTTTLGYDALDRLTSLAYSDGTTPNVSFGYDAHDNRVSMADGTGSTTYSYDEFDRPLSVTTAGPKTVGYRYDRDSNQTKVIYPDATAVTYAFDKAGRLESLVDWASRTTSYEYHPSGLLKRVTNPNGTTADYAVDNALRLAEVHNKQAGGATISRHTYTLDAMGSRTRADEALPGASATDYVSDRLFRLTGVTAPGGTTSYGYDPAHNRQSLTRGGSTTTYSYDRADRITAAGATAYTVDAAGNLTARGPDSFSHDQENRLKTANIGGTTASYAYDGDGLRTGATVGGSPTSFVHDVTAGLPILLDDGARKYVWGLGLAYAATAGGIEVYHADGLDSTRALSDASGTVVQRYETDEFGVPTTTTGGSAQPMRYTGEPRDAETGFVYLRTRAYDPAIGRFVQRDGWAGDPGRPSSLNRYAYVENDPANLTDPSGQNPLLAACAVGAGLNVGADLALGLATGAKLSGSQVLRSAGEGCVTGLAGAGLARGAAKLGAASCAINSFSGDTLVATPDGSRPIAEIRVGDLVLAWDEATGATGYYPVTGPIRHRDEAVLHLTIDGERLTTTAEHPFFVEGRGWVPAGMLGTGDRVRRADGSTGSLRFADAADAPQAMYNLEVGRAHTFFVGSGRWLVHNAKPCPNPNGRRGSPAHDATIHLLELYFKGRGWRHLSGGSLPEQSVPTIAGSRFSSRSPDLVVETPLGEVIAIQVGQRIKSGLPIWRERQAIADLKSAGLFEHIWFFKYK